MWDRARAGAALTPEDRAHVQGVTTWVTRTAAALVTAAYQAGGAGALATSSPLQRRMRDPTPSPSTS